MKKTNENRTDCLGDRQKSYEAMVTKTTLMPNTPVYCRIDGRAFHTFTRGLERPFDVAFNTVMQLVCSKMVEETNAILGYVQSDEISLAWEDISKAPFEGKLYKLESVLASTATAFFYQAVTLAKESAILKGVSDSAPKMYEKIMASPITFDCRIFNVPNMSELANAFIWRENDAVRNSINSVAQSEFSHKELQGKSLDDVQNMLLTQRDINWNNLPARQKRGVYFRRELFEMALPDEVWDKIPEGKKPESRMVTRSRVVEIDLPIMKKCMNKVGAYFDNETPLF